MKAQITQELKRKDRMENIKLGPGGIREIEFIGQAFQLIRGGTEKSAANTRHSRRPRHFSSLKPVAICRCRTTQRVIPSFYVRVENHIQQYQDRQTHDLPTSDKARLILAYSMRL